MLNGRAWNLATITLLGSHGRPNHPCQILSRLTQGSGGYRCPKSGVSHWVW